MKELISVKFRVEENIIEKEIHYLKTLNGAYKRIINRVTGSLW